ncbi:Peptide (Neuropeptide FF/F/Y) G protein-coupled receptor [Fasciolopsis buskii]|uniref:Peptide (Neuropeptide FF/F/Y) G protein-coupled receptor n=1 Tax=Fasciolopsis buskii TaxID=27845 RepID=A0A8E0RUL7_9TREM|nr:Peptide (Neuropeptide FF/F/Y) G protein-coupled receptor [Fasciolopsis buski]
MILFYSPRTNIQLHVLIGMIMTIQFTLFVSSTTLDVVGNPTKTNSTDRRTSDFQEQKIYVPPVEVLHHWITGQKTSQTETNERTTLNPIHAQWIMLHAGYGRPDFATHRISWIKIGLATLYSLLAVVGVVSNVTVVYILLIRRRRALANITNIFVLVLAISDVTLCGFNMPLQAYYELKETHGMNSTACKIVFTIFGIPMHVSCLTILMIACDRYQIIIYPLYPRMSTRIAVLLIALICLLSSLNSLPIALYNTVSQAVIPPRSTVPYMNNHTYTDNQVHTYCVEMWPNETGRLIYSLVTFLLHFFIPLSLTMGLYGHIFFRLHESRFRRSSVERKRRTNKILVRIVVCFAVCWTPWCCFSLWIEVHAFLWQTGALSTAGDLENLGRYDQISNSSMLPNIPSWMNPPTSEQTNTMEWVKLIVSHKAKSYLDRDLNRIELRSPSTTGNNLVSTNTALDASSMATLTSSLPVANPDLFSKLVSESHEEKIKLIDLILKLVAMGSGCINPWLYGWLNKFVITLSKLYWMKLTRSIKVGKKFREWNTRRQRNKLLLHSHNTNLGDQTNVHSADGVVNSNHIKQYSDAIVQVCFCCGNLCRCNFVFSRSVLFQGKKQDHMSFLSSAMMNGNSQRGSYRETSHRDSQRNAESCERCVATAGRSGTGSRTSQSGSGRQKGSKCSADNMASNVMAQLAEFDACLENAQQENLSAQNRRDKECHQCSSHKRFGRRYSSRLSASSVGTLSYLDPSTKQTSLLPSSGFTPTPRGSFLRPGEPATMMRLEPNMNLINFGTVENNRSTGNNLLVPPIMPTGLRGRSIDSGSFFPDSSLTASCNIQITEEQSQYSHTCQESETDLDNPVITLFCPQKILQTTSEQFQIKTELITLHEQSDSNSFDQGYNDSGSLSNHQEVVQINVHMEAPYNNTEIPMKTTSFAPQVSTGSNPFQVLTNPWSNVWLGPGVCDRSEPNKLMIFGEINEIPFADEDSEVNGIENGRKLTTVESNPEKNGKTFSNFQIQVEKEERVPTVSLPASSHGRSCETIATEAEVIVEPVKDKTNQTETGQREIKRRLSFYPGFIQRRKDDNREQQCGVNGGSRLRQTIRRLSHREPPGLQNKWKRSKVPVAQETKIQTSTEDSVFGTLHTQGFDESSDADDFTHIGRIVALEEIRKQQARNRALSVGSMLPTTHLQKKTRQSLSQVPTARGS